MLANTTTWKFKKRPVFVPVSRSMDISLNLWKFPELVLTSCSGTSGQQLGPIMKLKTTRYQQVAIFRPAVPVVPVRIECAADYLLI
jgi:hypothetical protein